jgi:Bifunctional DNA primase/polymerase, N-terminal
VHSGPELLQGLRDGSQNRTPVQTRESVAPRATSYFNRLADIVVNHGFTVTPTKGKEAFLPKWPNPKPTDPQWLAGKLARGGYPGCNLGIVCGRVVAIDIDADDPAKLANLEALATKHLGPTPFKRIGRSGRSLLLYRPGQGEIIPSIKISDCIDVLSGGRQFVAYGVHPDTGRNYEWASSRNTPATTRLEAVPVITTVALQAFGNAVSIALGRSVTRFSVAAADTTTASLKSRQRARQGEMLGSQYGSRIMRAADGRVIDGRESFMANLIAAEYAKATHRSPDDLGHRVWAQFSAEADLSRPKGSNPQRRWQLKDALAKARAICRRKPDLKPPRRSRGGHPASHLYAWRKPGFWTQAQRELHLAEAGQRITTPAVLAVARVMIEAVELASGFCTTPIAEIAKRASCSMKSVTKARQALRKSGLWIAGPGGVFVPIALNRNQVAENKGRKSVGGNTKVPSLYLLSLVSAPKPDVPLPVVARAIPAKPYQPDMFGAAVIDLAAERSYRRGLLPDDLAALVRAEMRARGVTQDELAAQLGISQPQLANALAGRFGLSPEPAARLLAWLREAA